MHILIVPSWYPQSADDIGGSFFREQAHALRKKGYKVGVIAPSIRSLRDWKGVFSKKYGMEYEVDFGLPTYRWHGVNFTPRLKGLSRAQWVRCGLRLFECYVRKNGVPDIIHVHSLVNAGYLAKEIKRREEVPYVVTEHSTSFARGLLSNRDLAGLRSVLDEASVNIAVSDEFRRLLDEMFTPATWKYIPNIVSDSFLQARIVEGVNSPTFSFINVCLLSKKKRVDLLVEAFAKVSEGRNDLRLKIGGDGPLKEELVLLSKKLGIFEKIQFLGAMSREEVLQHIAESDAFVLSSEYETFGVVLVEALALGKPVVATRCGGPESIVVPHVGYLVERNSVESLAEGMQKLYARRGEFKAASIREYCQKKFSEDAVVCALGQVYQRVREEIVNDTK